MAAGGGIPETRGDYPDVKITELEEFGEISLEVAWEEDKRLWREIMAAHHPEGRSRVPGRQVCYWITSPSRAEVPSVPPSVVQDIVKNLTHLHLSARSSPKAPDPS